MVISNFVITAIIVNSSLRETKSITIRKYFRAEFITYSIMVHVNIYLFIRVGLDNRSNTFSKRRFAYFLINKIFILNSD